MSTLTQVLSTALLPLVSFSSLSIYLATHPDSPIKRYFHQPNIALPTHVDEGLDGFTEEKDVFDLEDKEVLRDGTPVEPEKFWASMWKRKVLLLLALIPPFTCNIALLLFTIVSEKQGEEFTQALLIPVLIIPSHLVTVLLGVYYLGQNNTPSHWSTTVYLATNIFVQFLVLAIRALLPTTPLPHPPSEFNALTTFTRLDLFALPVWTPLEILKPLLPIVHIPALLIILMIPRGPPLHLPVSAIYPKKITDAIPHDHESLDPSIPNVTAEVQVTVPDFLMFNYSTAVIRKGYYSESMDVWDLPILVAGIRALPRFIGMRKIYGKNKGRLGKWEGYNLLWKLTKANKWPFSIQMTLAAITAVGYYLPHYILQLFLQYLESDPGRTQPSWGWFLAFSLFISNAIMYIITGVTWSIGWIQLSSGIRLQLNTLLYSKTLTKKDIAATGEDASAKVEGGEKEKDKKTEGDEDDEGVSSKTQIMTLFTVDVDRVTEFVWHSFAIVDAPIEIVIATTFLIKLLGTSALYGLLATIICLPLNHFASKVVVTAQENLMKARDQRTALMNEILQGIRMLKFMAWERSFEKRIKSIRTTELHWQARNYQIEVAFSCLWAITPVLVTVVSFLHFTLVAGNRLTPAIAFTAVAVFSELQYALSALPETFIQAIQSFVSCKRIEKYMSLTDVDPVQKYTGDGDIVLTNATITWPRDDSSSNVDAAGIRSVAATPKNAFTLADISARFPKGKLSLICGRLGSGKSLLLNGLLGEADLLAGQLDCPRSHPNAMLDYDDDVHIPDEDWVIPDMVAYVPQQAWLQNASIKDNIVFSSPWDAMRYQRVIEACSLVTDLQILEDGDETEIGEKGLNLSGGQKARVSLARAVYSRAGVLLLDDVLSAVDAHTAHAIMSNCLQGSILEDRTVLLVSHHTALVAPAAAFILALENGDVKFSGTTTEFIANGLMAELDAEDVKAKPTKGEKDEEKTVEETIQEKEKPTHKSIASLSGIGNEPSQPNSETSSIAPDDETLNNSEVEVKKSAPRKLIEDEKRAKGRIAWPVWKTYLGALGGPFWWMFFVVSLGLAMIVPVAEKGWLEYWTGTTGERDHSPTFYVVGYAIITLAGVFASNIQFGAIYYASLQASKKLHDHMLETVLFATLRFHDTTSRGRLLNRFGKDIEGLDSSMADNFVRSISYGLNVVVTFVSITYVGGLPFFFAGCVIMIVYYQAGSIYGQTSRDMRRLDSITKSPLYSLFGETVSGVAVLRAFGGSTIAMKNMIKLLDTNCLAFVWTWTVNRWLSARFNLLSSVVVGLTAVAVLIAPGVSAAMAGFAMSFANGLSHDLLFVVRRFVQLEQSMVALERIKEYSELVQEAPEFVQPRPAASWPSSGEISVEKLVIRYSPELPNVLHGISFSVAGREKIGIVGSTGCGKSTLALSFFRFVEATEGRITIDGIDISKIGLTDLRSRVTIIPQDPTILSGTLRSTLDVFDEYDDADIYEALRRVHLLKTEDVTGTAAVAADDALDEEGRNRNVFRDLSNPVSEGGDNFSSGEKQLICMARAILRRNKVLFMDEATASIDYETDELISKTIREEFSDATILTIAHRIHTIIDFDKVLVMDQGRIAEYASPAELLRDHTSKFYALCRATGKAEFKTLKGMAIEAERTHKVGEV